MSEHDAPEIPPESPGRHAAMPPTPRPGAALFAAVFVIAMVFNLFWDATHLEYEGSKITMFLGVAALLVLGVDVGKMIGRR